MIFRRVPRETFRKIRARGLRRIQDLLEELRRVAHRSETYKSIDLRPQFVRKLPDVQLGVITRHNLVSQHTACHAALENHASFSPRRWAPLKKLQPALITRCSFSVLQRTPEPRNPRTRNPEPRNPGTPEPC